VMLFSIERVAALGFPGTQMPDSLVAQTLDAVHQEMRDKYRARQRNIRLRLDVLRSLLHQDGVWWNRSAEHAPALNRFEVFVRNIEQNFGEESPANARVDSETNWAAWRQRQLDAIKGLPGDRRAWRQALELLSSPCKT